VAERKEGASARYRVAGGLVFILTRFSSLFPKQLYSFGDSTPGWLVANGPLLVFDFRLL